MGEYDLNFCAWFTKIVFFQQKSYAIKEGCGK
jgi:hypothetical protein